jgi:misacylated tRNA(Ala) deacylase
LQGLSVFILPQIEPLSRGRARIFFCAGPRIRAYLSETHRLLTTAATTYGCAAIQVPERFAFETEGRRKAFKRAEELEEEVAKFVVKDLLDEQQRMSANDADKHRYTAFRHRQDSSSNPLGLLNTIHSAWSASAASTHFLIILVSSGLQTSSNSAVVLIFGSDEKEVKQLGDKLKAKGIKGGGKPGKWSGKTDNWKTIGGDEWVKGLLES